MPPVQEAQGDDRKADKRVKRRKRLTSRTQATKAQKEAEQVEAALAGELYRFVVARFRVDSFSGGFTYGYKTDCGHETVNRRSPKDVPGLGHRAVCQLCETEHIYRQLIKPWKPRHLR